MSSTLAVQYFGLVKDFSFGNIIARHTHTHKKAQKKEEKRKKKGIAENKT